MTITNGYATLTQIKAVDRLNITVADTTSDTTLEGIITAISRAIDNQTNRYFYKSAAHEVRYFTAGSIDKLFVGDFVSITALYTDVSGDRSYPNTWATTDYDLVPYDAAAQTEQEPYRWIDVTPQGLYRFPKDLAKGVKLDAVYGWPSVPQAITEACCLWAERWWKRLKTPLGISAMSALGETTVKIPPPDPDVMAILSNYTMPVV